MTDREKAIVMAYTGYTMLAGDHLEVFYNYVEEKLGYRILTHELAYPWVEEEIHRASYEDFVKLCNDRGGDYRMTYREQVMETVRLTCQDIIDRVEELVPNMEGIISTEINIRIPTMTDKTDSIPTCEIRTEVYPRFQTAEKIINVISDI